MPNVHDLIQHHTSLSVTCLDRLYINGYVPTLQTSGQLCYFLREHLGNPVPSPALLGHRHDDFIEEVKQFAEREKVPLVRFERKQRKDEVAAGYRAKFGKPEGVVFIGVAQEKMSSFKAQKREGPRGGVYFDFSRQPVAVNHYYFYLEDEDWGPGFVKVGSYAPYPVKLCLNGHEWAKQQLRREGIGFESLDNGFLSCEAPKRLQEICDRLGPADVQGFFERWSAQLPWPLRPEDGAAGFGHKLSLWQMEISLTQVFDKPVQGRHFFEEVIRDNLDLGRPERVSLLFPKKLTKRTPEPAHGYRTRVITQGVNPSLHVEYKHSHVKQYFKEEKALRTETTINAPGDFGVNKGLENLEHLREIGKQVNRKLLEVEEVGQNCTLTPESLDRLERPTMEKGQRTPALRFGDPRVMALLHTLCLFILTPMGFRNADLRKHVAGLLGLDVSGYTPGQMTYDLRRLRRKGLIARRPRSNRYTVTNYGLKVAFFYTKVYLRIMRPGWAALGVDDIPRPLREALLAFETEIEKLCDDARLQPAA